MAGASTAPGLIMVAATILGTSASLASTQCVSPFFRSTMRTRFILGSSGCRVNLVASCHSAEELERAKSRLIADAIYAHDSQATMARWYGAALATGSTVEMVLSWPERIRAVTAETVHAAAKAWLDRRHSVTGYLIKDSSQKEEKRS